MSIERMILDHKGSSSLILHLKILQQMETQPFWMQNPEIIGGNAAAPHSHSFSDAGWE